MKNFKSFISESNPKVKQDNDGYDVLNTSFGEHSANPDDSPKVEKDKDGYDILNTSFGTHSIEENVASDHRELSDHYNKFTEEDQRAIGLHTYLSIKTNNYLHNRATSSSHPEDDVLQKRADSLNSALRKHKTPNRLTVFSGIHQSPEHLIKHQKGDKDGSGGVARTTNFTSTSIDKKIAGNFAAMDPHSIHNRGHGPIPVKHILKMHIPKGHPGAYVASYSHHPKEKEFILPPGTKMHVHHKPEYDEKNHSMVWTAHVLPHED